MPEATAQNKSKKSPRATQRPSAVPVGNETVPRFAPSSSSLGSAYAERILEEFRKELQGVDLKATKTKRPKSKKS